MSRENDQTIEVYERFGDRYLERNQNDINNDPKARDNDDKHILQLKEYLKGLPKDAKIFEVGSAGGRDAKLFQSLGYKNIVVSDVANRFLKLLKEEGFSPIYFNLITDNFLEKYDFIYCWAVLVHFTKNEAKVAIKKMFEALENYGRLALCVQYRDGVKEDWVDRDGKIGAKRYFSYWTKDELYECMVGAGFRKVIIEAHEGTKSCWLRCYAEK